MSDYKEVLRLMERVEKLESEKAELIKHRQSLIDFIAQLIDKEYLKPEAIKILNEQINKFKEK